MKTLFCVVMTLLVFFIVSVSSVQSQTQVVEGYTLVRGPSGTVVCLGRWIPCCDRLTQKITDLTYLLVNRGLGFDIGLDKLFNLIVIDG